MNKDMIPVLGWFLGKAWDCEKPWFFRNAAMALLNGLSPLVGAVALKFLIDQILGNRDLATMAGAVGVMIGFELLRQVCSNFASFYNKQADTRLELMLDRIIAETCATMDFALTEQAQVLDELEKAKNGVAWYSGGYRGLRESLSSMGSSLVSMAGSLAMLALLSPWLILMLGAFIALRLHLVNKGNQLWARDRRAMMPLNRRFGYFFGLIQRFRSAKDARLYQARGLFMHRAEDYLAEWEDFDRRRNKEYARVYGAHSALDSLQILGLYVWLGLEVLVRGITIGDFQMLLNGAGSFSGSISGLMGLLLDLSTRTGYFKDFRDFVLRPDRQTGQGGDPLPQTGSRAHRFEFQDVWFAYPGAAEDAWALKGLNLVLESGQRLSVVGENGAGKTTMVKLLARLYDPVRGRILLDGKDIRDFDPEAYQRIFAVVFQDYHLFSVTLEENLSTRDCEDSQSGLLDQIQAACVQTGVHERITALPDTYGTYFGKGFSENGVEFSGGETQKLAIARALVKDAIQDGGTTAILDEPTAALDPLAEHEVYRDFDQLVGGRTAIYISHRLSSCRFCDTIAVFHQGELVEHGNFDQLVALPQGKFRQLWEAQARFYQ